jgi:hypothetical protein
VSGRSLTTGQIRVVALVSGVVSVVTVLAFVGLGVWLFVEMDSGPSASETADDITLAVADNDFDTLCDLYSDDSKPDAIAAVGAHDCDDFVARQEAAIRGGGVDMKVMKVDESGDKATVTYSVRSGLIERTDELTLVREDGDWKIDGTPDFDPRDRPLRTELAHVLAHEGGLSATVADCVAGELHDSDLTDVELVAIVIDDRSLLTDDDVDDVTSVLTEALTTCGGGELTG